MSSCMRLRVRLGTWVVLGGGIIGLSAIPARAAQPAPAEPADKQPAKVEFANPELALLALFVGPWNVTETHFNTRGESFATVRGTEETAWILDHHAIRRTYTTKTESRAYEALGTLTYDAIEKKYKGVWFDNVSTSGPATVDGAWDKETRTFTFTVESWAKDGAKLRFKVLETFPDEERRVATTYALKGDEVIKRLEVQYKRYAPCPSSIRAIFGD